MNWLEVEITNNTFSLFSGKQTCRPVDLPRIVLASEYTLYKIVYQSIVIGSHNVIFSDFPTPRLRPTSTFHLSTWLDNILKVRLLLKCRMPKLVSLRTSLLNQPKSPVSGRLFASVSRQRLAQLRHGLLSEPWLTSNSVAPLPVTYFSPAWVRREHVEGLRKSDHKPPDERTLKLGKSVYLLSPDSLSKKPSN